MNFLFIQLLLEDIFKSFLFAIERSASITVFPVIKTLPLILISNKFFSAFFVGAKCRSLNYLPLFYNRNVAFDYLYIDDFLSAIDRFLYLDSPLNNTYNLCIGKAYKFKQIMETIADVVGVDHSEIILKDSTKSNYEYSGHSTLIEDEIGKVERTSLYEAISKLYVWYKNNDLDSLKLNSI